MIGYYLETYNKFSFFFYEYLNPLFLITEAMRLVAGFPLLRSGFVPKSGHVGFMVDKVTLGQVFS
jgi:hypothetical protein